jgi:anti-sigma B factor antagonist
MSKILDIDAREEGARHRLLLIGELDLTSSEEVSDAVEALCSKGAREIVLDISRLSFMDSTGLRAILNSKAMCEESMCDFALAPGETEVSEQLRRLFEVTGLLDRLPFRKAAQ